MGRLYEIIRRLAAKRYVEPESKLSTLEDICSFDPDSDAFFLSADSLPSMITKFIRFKTDPNIKIKGYFFFDEKVSCLGYYSKNNFSYFFDLGQGLLNTFSNTLELIQEDCNAEFVGTRMINGHKVLKIADKSKDMIRYFDPTGRIAFHPTGYNYKIPQGYDDYFGELLMRPSEDGWTGLYPFKGEFVFVPFKGELKKYTIDGKNYIAGYLNPNYSNPRFDKFVKYDMSDKCYNLCDRDGNLFSGYGGPHIDIVKECCDQFEKGNPKAIVAKSISERRYYGSYDKDGNELGLLERRVEQIYECFLLGDDIFLDCYGNLPEYISPKSFVWAADGDYYGDRYEDVCYSWIMKQAAEIDPVSYAEMNLYRRRVDERSLYSRETDPFLNAIAFTVKNEFHDLSLCIKKVRALLYGMSEGVYGTLSIIENTLGRKRKNDDEELNEYFKALYKTSRNLAILYHDSPEMMEERIIDMQKGVVKGIQQRVYKES